MGNYVSQSTELPKEELIDKRRTEVFSLFKGQKFLVVGGDGHGKSSFINTVNHAIRLSSSTPDVMYYEAAEMGPLEMTGTKTFALRTYTMGRGLFEGVTFSQDMQPISFIDTCGVGEIAHKQFEELIVTVAQGKVGEGTDLRKFFDEQADYESLLSDNNEDTRFWSIVFVVSARHSFPLDVARAVARACERCQEKQHGIRVFCVVTNTDIKGVNKKLEQLTKDLAAVLRISKSRIKTVINYTSEDIGRNMRIIPSNNKQQQLLALEAMLCFLLQTVSPSTAK